MLQLSFKEELSRKLLMTMFTMTKSPRKFIVIHFWKINLGSILFLKFGLKLIKDIKRYKKLVLFHLSEHLLIQIGQLSTQVSKAYNP